MSASDDELEGGRLAAADDAGRPVGHPAAGTGVDALREWNVNRRTSGAGGRDCSVSETSDDLDNAAIHLILIIFHPN